MKPKTQSDTLEHAELTARAVLIGKWFVEPISFKLEEEYGVSRELGLSETQKDKSIRFAGKTEIATETNNSFEL